MVFLGRPKVLEKGLAQKRPAVSSLSVHIPSFSFSAINGEQKIPCVCKDGKTVCVCVGRYFLPPRSPPFGLKMIDAPHFPETGQGGGGSFFPMPPQFLLLPRFPVPTLQKTGKDKNGKCTHPAFFFWGGGGEKRVVALDLRLLCHDVTSFALPP